MFSLTAIFDAILDSKDSGFGDSGLFNTGSDHESEASTIYFLSCSLFMLLVVRSGLFVYQC